MSLCGSIHESCLFSKLFHLLLFLLVPALIHSAETDSLKVLLEKTKTDSAKARLQLDLSEKLSKNESTLAKAYAICALEYYSKINDKKNMAAAQGSLALAYSNLGEYDQAIDYNLRALAYYEKQNLGFPEDTLNKRSLGIIYNKLGAVYYYLSDYNRAIRYWRQSLLVSEDLSDHEGQGYLLNNLGLIYEKQEKFDSALAYHHQSLKIKEALTDKSGISGSYNNIGNIYFHKRDFKIAIEYWRMALKLKYGINEKNGISNTLQNIGYGYFNIKDYSKALDYIHKGLKVAEEIQHKHYIKEAYGKLADVYYEMKNFEKAFEYQQLYGLIKDTLYNEQSAKKMAELETIYQSEKKEKEIQIKNLMLSEQDSEIKSQRITILASIGGGLLVFILAIAIFRAYTQKQKANLLLKKQKFEIELQKQIIEEKNRNITDSIIYAKHIQDAILPLTSKISEAFPESFILFMPKDIVSGDFYWLGEGEGTHLVALCDCTGHGVPGAFMSMIGSNTLTKIVSEQKITEPSKILDQLNRDIKSALKQKSENASSRDGMDVALCSLKSEGTHFTLQYAGANRPLIFFENGEIKEILPDKTSIGGFTETIYAFNNHTLTLQKGAMLYMFSDGYADQFGGPKGKKFMYKNMKELFRTIKNLPIREQEKTLREVFNSWKGEIEQVDDVLVIGIRV